MSDQQAPQVPPEQVPAHDYQLHDHSHDGPGWEPLERHSHPHDSHGIRHTHAHWHARPVPPEDVRRPGQLVLERVLRDVSPARVHLAVRAAWPPERRLELLNLLMHDVQHGEMR